MVASLSNFPKIEDALNKALNGQYEIGFLDGREAGNEAYRAGPRRAADDAKTILIKVLEKYLPERN